HNPAAQAQLMERMVEAIRKGYWDADEATRRRLVERWQELASEHNVHVGEEATRAFVEQMAAGFGLASASEAAEARGYKSTQTQPVEPSLSAAPQPVQGQLLEQMQPASE